MSVRPRDNRGDLVRTVVAGRVAHARLPSEMASVDAEGVAFVLPGAGGVNLGVHAGDPVAKFAADHLMVGASIEDADAPPATPGPLHLLSCIGNAVRDGTGRPIGVVAGKRGGLAPGFLPPNLVSVEMTDETAANMMPAARVVVEAVGRGLVLLDWPELALFNLSPRLLDALPLRIEGKRLALAVRASVPPRWAGPGLGQDPWVGDLEIAVDPGSDTRIAGLSFGDLVVFEDIDGRVSRFYRPGYLAIGLVSHGPSQAPGHGIGVTLLLSGPRTCLAAEIGEAGQVGGLVRRWSEDAKVKV